MLARCLAIFSVFACVVSPVAAEKARGPQVAAPVTPFVFDGDVRDLPAPAPWKPGDPIRDVPQRFFEAPSLVVKNRPRPRDPLLSRQLEAATRSVTDGATTPTRDFDGLGFTGLAVPDSVGDVGPDHYVQAVNGLDGSVISALVRIFDKATPTPNVLATFNPSDLATGPCDIPWADPVVLYDRIADRWVLSEITGSVTFCVYVSQTGDPVAGGWFVYQFTSLVSLPDYLKLAIWATDANSGAGSYVAMSNEQPDAAVYAIDRQAMLAGMPAAVQSFPLAGLPAFGAQVVLAAHPLGPDPPPAGSPVPILRHRDTELHGGSAVGDLLEIWELSVDWVTPANSTLTGIAGVDVTDFDSTTCEPMSYSCFVQPDAAAPLNPLKEALMYRLNYVNRGSHEAIIGNFTVDADGQDQGGVRWFELRRPSGGTWSVYDEGTLARSQANLWMASIGIDARGNLALGYNETSAVTYPSLLYTGRRSFDPAGQMTLPAVTVGPGTAVAETTRYGDYSLMAVDPADDCTFWLTGQYSVPGEWRTRVSTFRFDSCGCPGRPDSPSATATAIGDNRIELTWTDALEAATTDYWVQRSTKQDGPYETIATVADSSPGSGAGPGYVFEDDTASGGLTYHYVVLAANGTCPSDPSAEVMEQTTGVCLLPPAFPGLQSAASTAFDTCRVDLSWAPATPCNGASLYNVYRSTTPGFTPGPGNLLVDGLTGTAATDVSGLVDGQDYAYIVRAKDSATGVEDTNLAERVVFVSGPGGGNPVLLEEDFADGVSFAQWTITNGALHRCGEWVRDDSIEHRPQWGSGFYALAKSQSCGPTPNTNTTLDSPVIDASLPGVQTVTLQVDVYYAHLDGDDATIQVWDGSSWQVLWSDPDADVIDRLIFDVTAYAAGNPAFQVRFDYRNAQDDRWFAVDNVKVSAQVDNPCTPSGAPPPAPDGTGGTTAVRATRPGPGGSTLEISFDTLTCPAATYHLLYGDLASAASYALTGASCGVTSPFVWTGVPAGDLYFLVVGSDGVGTESSWGTGAAGERNGLTVSGFCGSQLKDVAGACP